MPGVAPNVTSRRFFGSGPLGCIVFGCTAEKLYFLSISVTQFLVSLTVSRSTLRVLILAHKIKR